MNEVLLEVCVDSVSGLQAAVAGGADRIELCSALELGGLTPSPGLMRLAAGSPVPVYAMIRPRSGDFVFSRGEVEAMFADIDAVRAAGLAGVVLGANLPGGRLDEEALGRLVRHAVGLGKTLHRAFDLVPHPPQAVETAIELGFSRILTSGGAPTAVEGLETLRAVFAAADDRIAVMPGSGVTVDSAPQLLAALPIREIHASCSAPRPATEPRARALGFDSGQRRQTSADLVAALRKAVQPARR